MSPRASAPAVPRASGSAAAAAGGPGASPATPGVVSKPDSFSFVAEPTLRFVTNLPLQPEPEDEGVDPAASTTNSAPAATSPAAGSSTTVTASTALPLSAATHRAPQQAGAHQADSAGASQQKRKRRVGLGALLHKKPGDRASAPSAPPDASTQRTHATGSSRGIPVPAARSQQAPPPDASLSASPGTTSTPNSFSASPPASSPPTSASPASSYSLSGSPPLAAPPTAAGAATIAAAAAAAPRPPFGPYPTASPPPSFTSVAEIDSRPSLTDTGDLSSSSRGSLLAESSASEISSAPTSPPSTFMRDTQDGQKDPASEQASVMSLHTAMKQDQAAPGPNGPSAQAAQTSGSSTETTPPINLGLGQSRYGSGRTMDSSSSATSNGTHGSQGSTAADESRLSYSRSITRNIESLALSNLPSRSGSSRQVPSAQNARPNTRSAAASSSSRAGQPSLRGMPRLLSTSGIPSSATHAEEEQEPDESETDTEAEDESSDHSDEEGEHYAIGDEGPVTSRSPAGTPGLSNPAPLATPRPNGASSFLGALPTPSFRAGRPNNGPGQPGWVAFSGSTPTPGPMRSSRIQGAAGGATSYFDMPRAPNAATGRTPSGVPVTPFAPMSVSAIARGKRPEMRDDAPASPMPARTPGPVPVRTPGPVRSPAAVNESPSNASADAGVRSGLYRLRSQSVVALASPSMVDDNQEQVGTAGITGLDPVWQTGVAAAQRTPAPSFLSFSLDQPGAAAPGPQSPAPASVVRTPAPAEMPNMAAALASPKTPDTPSRSRPQGVATGGGYRLQRTRSMYELRVPPPPYENAYGRPGQPAQIVQPREEEGREGLPEYTCAIHIEGYMPRKMEFTAPGVQARDRTWRKQYFVLHGTSIKIYKHNLRTHPIPGEEDWSAVPVDIAGHDGPPPLHFHEGEYGIAKDSLTNGHHRFPMSIDEVKAKAKDRIVSGAGNSAQNVLVRHYSLQNAESGLAADYIKRKHVVRVRAEGEQFLLQAKDDRGVIDLIEALQAATNVSLDLDARPLPKFITLPRRRRRRRVVRNADGTVVPAGAAGAAAATPPNGTGESPPSGAAASAAGRDRMGDMLAEEQTSNADRTDGTVM